ncbi:MAG TPA: hypothetical protein VEY30_12450, partial [Myxococcaceae bacterium]|nr:hypothetical protein [Myxococcaceae bacterium]
MTEVLARLRDKVSALSAPTAFHGTTARPPFFEGWYYKWVDAQGLRPWAVIPGVCHATDPAESHAFVQLYDGRSRRRIYARYPLDAFHASSRRFDVRIGPNHFTADGVALSLTADGHDVEGRVRCEGLSPWPVSALYPGYMGWMALTPFIGCYHAVLSLDHGLSGSLAVDGERVPFDGGRGYTEKDW